MERRSLNFRTNRNRKRMVTNRKHKMYIGNRVILLLLLYSILHSVEKGN